MTEPEAREVLRKSAAVVSRLLTLNRRETDPLYLTDGDVLMLCALRHEIEDVLGERRQPVALPTAHAQPHTP